MCGPDSQYYSELASIYFFEVVCRPVHPVLLRRREDIDIDRILGEPEQQGQHSGQVDFITLDAV
jgi:hypothetical protein